MKLLPSQKKPLLISLFCLISCFYTSLSIAFDKLQDYVYLGEFSKETAQLTLQKIPQSNMVYIKSVSDVMDHIQAIPYVIKEQLEFFKQYED